MLHTKVSEEFCLFLVADTFLPYIPSTSVTPGRTLALSKNIFVHIFFLSTFSTISMIQCTCYMVERLYNVTRRNKICCFCSVVGMRHYKGSLAKNLAIISKKDIDRYDILSSNDLAGLAINLTSTIFHRNGTYSCNTTYVHKMR